MGRDQRHRHTDTPFELDLSSALARLDEDGITDIGPDVTSKLREYVRKRGFIAAGDLRPLDERFLLAHELIQAIDVYTRLRSTDDATEYYVLSLFRGLEDDERPEPDAVPSTMWEARGVGYTKALRAYQQDLHIWLDDHPDTEARQVLDRLDQQRKRVAALQGDVDPTFLERLIDVARDVGTYLQSREETQNGSEGSEASPEEQPGVSDAAPETSAEMPEPDEENRGAQGVPLRRAHERLTRLSASIE